jgi:prepilin-type N-terminal cleavage/methylation domain-containing protein
LSCGGRISSQTGFTLIELLVVISILAAVAFIAGGAMSGVREQSAEQLVRSEMQQIAAAIRQFRQDTGYYPKTGPFALGGVVQPSNAPAGPAALALWFYSPANFYQLFENPLPAANPLASWDAETGRGWRGPYLQGFAEGFVDIRSGINNGTPAGYSAGDPLGGSNIPDVEGIADPFEHRPVIESGDTLLDWSAGPGGVERQVWGRPYLLFDLDSKPRLISMGPDGVYGNGDDIELRIE